MRATAFRGDEDRALKSVVGYNNLACNIHPNTYKLTFVAKVSVDLSVSTLIAYLCLHFQTEDFTFRLTTKRDDLVVPISRIC